MGDIILTALKNETEWHKVASFLIKALERAPGGENKFGPTTDHKKNGQNQYL